VEEKVLVTVEKVHSLNVEKGKETIREMQSMTSSVVNQAERIIHFLPNRRRYGGVHDDTVNIEKLLGKVIYQIFKDRIKTNS